MTVYKGRQSFSLLVRVFLSHGAGLTTPNSACDPRDAFQFTIGSIFSVSNGRGKKVEQFSSESNPYADAKFTQEDERKRTVLEKQKSEIVWWLMYCTHITLDN